MESTLKLDHLTVGASPLVVGAISSAKTLERQEVASTLRLDIAEFRLDLAGFVDSWHDRAREFRAAGKPVLLTLRSEKEGGRWSADESTRFAAYIAALSHVSAIDVEVRSEIASDLARIAHEAGKSVVMSFHDFARMPPAGELQNIISLGFSRGADIVKIAVRTEVEADIETLRGLLRSRGESLLSTIGMGGFGPASRVELALAGSCLTYGFADETNAPGQISSGELIDRLRERGARTP